ncbi:Uracil-DNA glycosylase [Trichinella spiralis]|uniref:Uracil-DNA glycosylase n=1 Tax=Trichinella spiralis TaxID=6334 RepID=A0ABR3KXF2_TRISP
MARSSSEVPHVIVTQENPKTPRAINAPHLILRKPMLISSIGYFIFSYGVCMKYKGKHIALQRFFHIGISREDAVVHRLLQAKIPAVTALWTFRVRQTPVAINTKKNINGICLVRSSKEHTYFSFSIDTVLSHGK